MENKNFFRRLIIRAGHAAQRIYNQSYEVDFKEDNSPLTEADRKANKIIISALREEYPDYAILTEETGSDPDRLEKDYCFIIDPLDGTKEFINRTGEYTVNIALAYKGKVIMGFVYAPAKEVLYYAYEDEGAYREDLEKGFAEILFVSNSLWELKMVKSKSHSSEKEEKLYEDHKDKIIECVSAGSSLKGCMVADTSADIYYRFGLTNEWDVAAMHIIVEEAGGIFRQMDGSEMTYNRENPLNEKGFYVVNRKENIWV